MGNLNDTAEYCPPHNKPWRAHCAVDVGSVSCGYAYSFADTDHVWINNNWTDQHSFVSHRAPSAVLYDKSGLPVKFGSEACDWFIENSQQDVDQHKFYYDGLLGTEYTSEQKFSLDPENVVDETPATDTAEAGTRLHPTVMKHRVDLTLLLSVHCKHELETKYRAWGRAPDDIVWTFVVPLSWDIEEKRRFREMLINSFELKHFEQLNADPHKVHLVTSTDALWVALQSKSLGDLDAREKAVILVHAGGERTELSVHTDNDGRVPVATKLLHLGGNYINRIFESHFCKSLGPDGERFVNDLKQQYPALWMEFLLRFESVKTAFCYESTPELTMDIHYDFAEAFSKLTSSEINATFEEMSKSTDKTQLELSHLGKLVLNVNLIKWLNIHLCYLVTAAVTDLIKEVGHLRVGALVLTGGLGTSSFLRSYLRLEQEKQKLDITHVYTHQESTTLVSEGAVLCSKKTPELRNTFALVYASSTFESSEKGLTKLYPIFSKGQTVEVGMCMRLGPIMLDMYFDQAICFNICQVKKHMEVLPDGKFYLLSTFGDSIQIGQVKLDLAPHDCKKRHTVTVDAIMDASQFKITMNLESSNPKKKISVLCPYE